MAHAESHSSSGFITPVTAMVSHTILYLVYVYAAIGDERDALSKFLDLKASFTLRFCKDEASQGGRDVDVY